MTKMISQHAMDHFARTWCLPTMLLLNFACFQYLVLLFHRRWREPRVLLLLTVTGIGAVALVPFATQDDDTIDRLNDVSESCLALLLLVQTVLVGSRHSTGPILSPSKGLHVVADLLVVYDCVVVVLGIIAVFDPSITRDFGGATVMNNMAENLTLAFTFVYRFGILAMTKTGGWRRLLREDNWELFWHLVFVTHEYLFMLLEWHTGVALEFLQAIYMRLAILPCVWMTIGDHHDFHIVRHTLHKIASREKLTNTAKAAMPTAGVSEKEVDLRVLSQKVVATEGFAATGSEEAETSE